MGATQAVANFIAQAPLDQLPPGSDDRAKKAITDTFAAIIAGSGSEVAEPLLRYAGVSRSRGATPVLGTGLGVTPETAALINGAFGAALDYDDVLSMMPAHPSAVIVPAMLAGIDEVQVTGREFIDAYIVGIEVGGKIGQAITLGHYTRGFHGTGTLAMFSALAALARLHRLDPPLTQQAFGIAGSMASGLRRNFGTMTKPLHSGLAARNALQALRLAQSGFTAAGDILEARAGFFATYGVAESDAEQIAASLGKPWVIVEPGLAQKKFPCCYAMHRGMDGLLTLRERLQFDSDLVDRIECRMPPGGMQVLTDLRPVTGLEGKFSLEYGLAAGALDGGYTLSSFSDGAVRRPEIEALYQRIAAFEDPSCRGDDPRFDQRSSGSRGFVEVEVWLKDGRSEMVRIDTPPGSPERAASWDDVRAKLLDSASSSPGIAPATASALFESLQRLEGLADVSVLTRLLAPQAG